MVAQVHASHWVEGSRFMSNKRVERMGTSDSLTKAIFVSLKQLHPGPGLNISLDIENSSTKNFKYYNKGHS